MKIQIDTTTYDIPTSYTQTKYLDFAHAQTPGLSLEKKLSHQTGIPVETLCGLPWSAISKLAEVVSFNDELPGHFEPYQSEMNVGNEHYIKLEQSRRALAQSENQWLGVIDVVKTYTGVDISELPVVKAFGYAVFFLNRSNSSSPATSDSEHTKPMKTS